MSASFRVPSPRDDLRPAYTRNDFLKAGRRKGARSGRRWDGALSSRLKFLAGVVVVARFVLILLLPRAKLIASKALSMRALFSATMRSFARDSFAALSSALRLRIAASEPDTFACVVPCWVRLMHLCWVRWVFVRKLRGRPAARSERSEKDRSKRKRGRGGMDSEAKRGRREVGEWGKYIGSYHVSRGVYQVHIFATSDCRVAAQSGILAKQNGEG